MTAPESRRHELYNGLTEILGTDLTDTLMSYLPVTPAAALATKQELQELRDEIRHLSMRIDRLQLTLIAGFISMVVALIVVGFFG